MDTQKLCYDPFEFLLAVRQHQNQESLYKSIIKIFLGLFEYQENMFCDKVTYRYSVVVLEKEYTKVSESTFLQTIVNISI